MVLLFAFMHLTGGGPVSTEHHKRRTGERRPALPCATGVRMQLQNERGGQQAAISGHRVPPHSRAHHSNAIRAAEWCSPRARSQLVVYTEGVASSADGPGRAVDVVTVTALRSLVVFAAHPDDIESWCAGTLALAADAGATVHVVIATSGESGAGAGAPRDVALTREAEARAGARLLRIPEPQFLRFPDGGLGHAEALLPQCRACAVRYRPDLILSFDTEQPSSMVPHPDHLAIGQAALRAGAKGVPIWLFSMAAANCVVDIAPVFERKVAARAAHRSQTSDPILLRADWAERAQRTGAPAGLALAEAFRAIE